MAIEKAPLNVRIWADGMSKNYKQGPINSLIAMVTLLLYTGWMHILLVLFCFVWYRPVAYFLILLFSTLALPAKPVLWTPFCKMWLFKTWREYFNFSYMFEEALDSQKKYVFVEFPHGVYPVGPLIAATECQAMFPGFNIFGLAATVVFSIPFWRHFMAWMGSVPATSSNFRKVLKKGSVAVIVGGIAEMYLQHPHKERIMLRERKGFVRVAVEEGADGGIVPVYHFGNTKIFDFWPQALAKTSRSLRMALGLHYGRFGLPLPRRVPIFMVCGKPIPVTRMSRDDPGFEAYVDELHARVVDATQKLYDDNKARYGWQDRPLEIL